MKLMLSNDDGINAPGIRALAGGLCGEHRLTVVAPDSERSAVSRGMTLSSPLRACPVTLAEAPGASAYAVSGTPVDCVRLGLGNLAEDWPDMVLSGVNHGANLGTDALYSGTVSAAHEAALLGVQAIAMSVCSFHPEHLDTAVEYARRAIRFLQAHPLPFGVVLNVNVPDLPMEQIKGVRFAPVGLVQYKLAFIQGEDPMGTPYYWPPRGRITPEEPGQTDFGLCTQGYVTATPLTYDLTCQGELRRIEEGGWTI